MAGDKFMAALKELDDAVSWLRDSAEPGEKPSFVPSYEQARKDVTTAFQQLRASWKLSPDELATLEGHVDACLGSYDEGDLDQGEKALLEVQALIWKARATKRKPGQIWR